MDTVTDIFQNVQIAGVIHARLEATAPWGLEREVNAKNGVGRYSAARSLFPFAHFGMLIGGDCWVRADGLPDAIPLSDGDCFLFAPGRPYTLGDNPQTSAQSFCSVAIESGVK